MKTDKNSVKVTAWITTAEATKFIKDAIESGKYKKGEIRKSSYRWADPKDHSKGYLCRVLIPAKAVEPAAAEQQVEPEVAETPEVVETPEVAPVVEVAKAVEKKTKKAKAKAKKVA